MVISALQARARQVRGTGQVKQGEREGKKQAIREVVLFAFAAQKAQQVEKGVRPAGRPSLLAQQQDRKLEIRSGETLWATGRWV